MRSHESSYRAHAAASARLPISTATSSVEAMRLSPPHTLLLSGRARAAAPTAAAASATALTAALLQGMAAERPASSSSPNEILLTCAGVVGRASRMRRWWVRLQPLLAHRSQGEARHENGRQQPGG